MRICRMHPGHTTIRIRCTGLPAHSSRPELGLSAIVSAAAVVERLNAVAESWRRTSRFEGMLPSPYPVMNVGRIEGGTAINIVPDHCVLDVGIRPLPGQAGGDLADEVRNSLAPLRKQVVDSGGDIEVEVVQLAPSMLTEDGTPLAGQLVPHAASPDPCGAPFATDGGHLSRLGTKCLVFGPGSIDVAHRPDEYIHQSVLVHTVDIIENVIRERCIESALSG
jgi:acetylornithine deacetylase